MNKFVSAMEEQNIDTSDEVAVSKFVVAYLSGKTAHEREVIS